MLDVLGLFDVLYYTGDRPYRKYSGDAGYDLRVSKRTVILPNIGIDVPCSTAITSRRMWMLLIGRSSTLHKKGLMVGTAIIDNGFSDKLRMFVYNTLNEKTVLKKGERIGQVIPFRLSRTALLGGCFLRHGSRGNRGFGSTGEI